jgi:hypothetical protein
MRFSFLSRPIVRTEKSVTGDDGRWEVRFPAPGGVVAQVSDLRRA